MRLIFIVANLLGGGVQRVAANLTTTAAQRDIDVEVVALTALNAGHLDFGSAKLTQFPGGTVKSGLLPLRRFLSRLSADDIIITGQPHINIAVIALARLVCPQTRVFITEHNPLDVAITQKERIIQSVKWPFYKRASGIVCVAEAIRQSLIDHHGFTADFVKTIYNPVRPPTRSVSAPVNQKRENTICCVGRLHYQKNFSLAIQAFRAFLDDGGRGFLRLIGEGDERNALMDEAAALLPQDSYCFEGFCTDIYQALQNVDCLLLSSRWEGFGIVLIEAMLMGINVVSTRCDGPLEILDDGAFGKIVSHDPAEIAAALKATFAAPVAAGVLKERAHAISDPNVVLDRYLAFVGWHD